MVNEHLQTNAKNIYAIGDVIKGAMLAHKAEEEGIFVAETLAGQMPHINYLLIPGVVYTWPEVASVGYTEEELKITKREYKSGSFPFKASGRARASMDTDGFVKVLADKNYLIFFIASILICIPLAFYYGQANQFLNEAGLESAAAKMTLGQVSETLFLLLMPLFFVRFGIKQITINTKAG